MTPVQRLLGAALLALVPLAAARADQVAGPGEKGIQVGGSYTSADREKALSDIAASGGRWVRHTLNWSSVQGGGASSWDWSDSDAWVAAFQAHGLKVLMTIGGDTPSWAKRTSSSDSQSMPKDLTSWRAFAASAARRYAPQGVHAWEIYNEAIYHAKAGQYGPVLRAGFLGIRGVDPTAEVVTSGNPLDAGSGVRWVQDLYALGYGPDFTAVGAHPYDYTTLPSQGGNWNFLDTWTPNLRAVMTANGDAGKRIWLTEYGYASCNPANPAWTEQREAQYLSDAFATAAAKPWAGPLVWYSYRDEADDCSTTENNYGIVNADMTPKADPHAAFAGAGGTGGTGVVPNMTAFVADIAKLQTATAAVKTTADLSSLDALITQLQAELTKLQATKAALARTRRLP